MTCQSTSKQTDLTRRSEKSRRRSVLREREATERGGGGANDPSVTRWAWRGAEARGRTGEGLPSLLETGK